MNSQTIDDDSLAAFKNDLIASNILNAIDPSPDGNAEDTYTKINDSLLALKEKHFPVKRVRFRRYQHKVQPWMTDIILLNIKIKDEAYVKFRKAKTPIERTKWKSKLKQLERDITEWITEAKANYYTQQLEKHKNDIKKTWETIKTAIDKRRHKSAFPEFFKIGENNIFDKTDIANGFNRYFVNIGRELADSLDSTGKPHFSRYLGPKATSRFSFQLVNSDTILKLIGNLTPKPSAGPDGISSIILRAVAPEISPLLAIAINQSLTSGVFPSSLKIAKVIPLYKNKGESTDFGNYRPISLLNVISKIFERVVYNQVYAYFIKHNLFYSSQYGFRTQHSTEDAAIELVDQIYKAFEDNPTDEVLAIFLDLSKAFDTIDHEILF